VRIGVVNDVQLAVMALRRLIESDPEHEVAWIAADGAEALANCRTDTPDLVLMDLVMPNMDGVEATRRIMAECPCAILIVTATVEGNLTKVYHALGAGALDAVSGPTFSADGALQDTEPVLRKIRRIGLLTAPSAPTAEPRAHASSAAFPSPFIPAPRLVVIGASTGGPQAIVDTVKGFGSAFRPAVIVVQHLDVTFVPGFVSWLASQTGWPVRPIEEGAAPSEGEILVASSRDHLVMSLSRHMRYDPRPEGVPYRPSVDAFFYSLQRTWPTPGVAVLLTGMGRDGAAGLLALKQVGWATLAQDEATSVVYGMPRAAEKLGAAMAAVAVDKMGARIEREWGRLAKAAESAPERGA
jgi:two-component system, chemotaxis family, response regulator WspF